MIFLDGHKLDLMSFPDGTSSFRCPALDLGYAQVICVMWYYSSEEECIRLWYLAKHLRAKYPNKKHILQVPYLPNARMDRVKNEDEVFTLKWFSEFINAMRFDEVRILDPHSDVCMALIDHAVALSPREYVNDALSRLADKEVLLCYPDEGSAKRYAAMLGADYVFCIKHRDWRTGNIERLELTAPEKVKGRNILIVDDICSKGGTFTYTAKALKAAGANEIYLYVTHCEPTIYNGSVLTDGLIEKVFTTGSIYVGDSPKVVTLGI